MSTEDADGSKSDVECPTCGEGYKNKQGLGVHHAKKHGISIREYERREAIEEEHGCPTCEKVFGTPAGVAAHHQWNHSGPYPDAVIREAFGVPIEWYLETLHHILGISVRKMAKAAGLTSGALEKAFDRHDISRRNRTDAMQVYCDGLTKQEKKNRIVPAREGLKKGYAGFRTDEQGYEVWNDAMSGGQQTVRVHRLLATLLVDDISELDGMAVHHTTSIPWLNIESCIEVMGHGEHSRLHRLQESRNRTD